MSLHFRCQPVEIVVGKVDFGESVESLERSRVDRRQPAPFQVDLFEIGKVAQRSRFDVDDRVIPEVEHADRPGVGEEIVADLRQLVGFEVEFLQRQQAAQCADFDRSDPIADEVDLLQRRVQAELVGDERRETILAELEHLDVAVEEARHFVEAETVAVGRLEAEYRRRLASLQRRRRRRRRRRRSVGTGHHATQPDDQCADDRKRRVHDRVSIDRTNTHDRSADDRSTGDAGFDIDRDRCER